jgi:hypothetical protein
MKKHSDKLPLPKRYEAAPTTGEVLYEYICASEKLRAAAVLHIYDSWLQGNAREAKKKVKLLRMWTENRGDVLTSDKLAEEKKKLADAENAMAEDAAFASTFRDVVMQRWCGMKFPIPFLHSIPCSLRRGTPFPIPMLISLSLRRRYDEMREGEQNLWDVALMIMEGAGDVALDPGEDLKKLAGLWIDPKATDEELRKTFRAALKQRNATLRPKAGRRGRPSTNEGLLPPKSALNDLWHYLILRKVAEHTGRPLEDLIAPELNRAKPQAETLAGMIANSFDADDLEEAKKQSKGKGVKLQKRNGKLDTKRIKVGASNAASAFKALELDCPAPSINAMAYADYICAMMKECDAEEKAEAEAYNAEERNADAVRQFSKEKIHAEILALASNKTSMVRLPQETLRQ